MRPPSYKQRTKKNHDQYLHFCSKRHSEIINASCGSLVTLISVSRIGLDSHYFLHIGMDVPNVNLAFEKKLRQYFEDELGSSFLLLGSCSLNPVHTAFRKKHSHLTLTASLMIYTFFSSFLVP